VHVDSNYFQRNPCIYFSLQSTSHQNPLDLTAGIGRSKRPPVLPYRILGFLLSNFIKEKKSIQTRVKHTHENKSVLLNLQKENVGRKASWHVTSRIVKTTGCCAGSKAITAPYEVVIKVQVQPFWVTISKHSYSFILTIALILHNTETPRILRRYLGLLH